MKLILPASDCVAIINEYLESVIKVPRSKKLTITQSGDSFIVSIDEAEKPTKEISSVESTPEVSVETSVEKPAEPVAETPAPKKVSRPFEMFK